MRTAFLVIVLVIVVLGTAAVFLAGMTAPTGSAVQEDEPTVHTLTLGKDAFTSAHSIKNTSAGAASEHR